MFERKKTSWTTLSLAFVAGFVAGAAVALIYAPMTGRKMQKKVGNVTDKVMDAVEEQVENVQGMFRKIATA